MGHGEAVEDSFLSLVDAMAHGKNKIVYFSGLFWDWFAGKGKEGMFGFEIECSSVWTLTMTKMRHKGSWTEVRGRVQ